MTRKCIILGAVFVVVMACLYAGFLVGQANPKRERGVNSDDLGELDQLWVGRAIRSDWIPSALQELLLELAPIDEKEAIQATYLLSRLLVGTEETAETVECELKNYYYSTSVRFTHDDQKWVVSTVIDSIRGFIDRVEIERPHPSALSKGNWASLLWRDANATPLTADSKALAELRACEYAHILDQALGFCRVESSSFDQDQGQWTVKLRFGSSDFVSTVTRGARKVILSEDGGLVFFE